MKLSRVTETIGGLAKRGLSLVLRIKEILIPRKPAAPPWYGMPASREARQLNELLYADVKAIPTEKVIEFRERLAALCRGRQYGPEYTDSWNCHSLRLYLSIEWLRPVIESHPKGVCLELGSDSVVSDLMRQTFPHAQWKNIASDLRLPWDLEAESADLIVCTEVIEHLSDLPEGVQDTFSKKGLAAMLRECYLSLKRGGHLFLTTPNAASILQTVNALGGNSPWFYALHIREYTFDEAVEELKNSGFDIELADTVHCLTAHLATDYSPIFQIFLEYNFPTRNRGDDIFIVARKP